MLLINIFFFSKRQVDTHTQHNQAHFTIAYDKSVFLSGELTFLKSKTVERQTILKAAKQGGRRNATEKKTASDVSMILNIHVVNQAY